VAEPDYKTSSAATRERLPETRKAVTHKFQIADLDGYIIVGLYPNGRPGEVFLKMGKEGSTVGGLLDAVGILTSVALQHGVPLRQLTSKLSHVRFEPSGFTQNKDMGYAHSILDYIYRWLQASFPEADDAGEQSTPQSELRQEKVDKDEELSDGAIEPKPSTQASSRSGKLREGQRARKTRPKRPAKGRPSSRGAKRE
jgi:ribonucleoside-diphosphate reductase alpha chain